MVYCQSCGFPIEPVKYGLDGICLHCGAVYFISYKNKAFDYEQIEEIKSWYFKGHPVIESSKMIDSRDWNENGRDVLIFVKKASESIAYNSTLN